MIYYDEETGRIAINNLLIASPDEVALDATNLPADVRGNLFLSRTGYVDANRFHKLLMWLHLLPKSPVLLVQLPTEKADA